MPTIQNRRASKAQWDLLNPVLAAGEIGYVVGINKFKIGNGLSTWSSLKYFVDESVTQSGTPLALMSADALAPFIYRLKRNEALRLGIVASSTFSGAGLFEPWVNGAGVMCWKAIKEKYGNTAAIIEGRGASGSTINHILLGGVNPNMISAEGAVKGGNYDAIIINMNHDNDVNAGTTADQFYDRMRLAILSVKRAGAIPIVVPPLKFGTYWTTAPNYIAATYKACAVTGAVLIPIEGELNLPDDSGIDPQWYQSDLIHANAAGAIKYGEAFATYFPDAPNPASTSPATISRGTWDDPQFAGKFFHWTDSLGFDRRSASTLISSETDGRPASTPVLLSPELLIRNSRFATDLRNPGNQSIADANAREAAGFLGNSAGDTTYDPPFLTNGGVVGASGQERCFTIPTSTRTDLQFGRDDVAVSLVVGPWAQVNGATQVLMARRTDGGVENLMVRTDPANGNLIVKVGGVENTILQATHGLHDTKTHLLTVTAKGNTGIGQLLVDGVSKSTLAVGTINSHGSTITPLPFMFLARPGTSVVWWAFAQVHWLDIANAYIGALEDQGRLPRLKTALAARSLPWV